MAEPVEVGTNTFTWNAVRAEVFRDLEAAAHRNNSADDADTSVNDWVSRLKETTFRAHSAARDGRAKDEYDAWLDAAGTAILRAEQVLFAIQLEEGLEPDRSEAQDQPSKVPEETPADHTLPPVIPPAPRPDL
jgi:hypothetical protein